MSIVFTCPACAADHRSRLIASRRKSFSEVIPQIGDVLEVCPVTHTWVTIGYRDMLWTDEPKTPTTHRM
jgi:hypothetical protein